MRLKDVEGQMPCERGVRETPGAEISAEGPCGVVARVSIAVEMNFQREPREARKKEPEEALC